MPLIFKSYAYLGAEAHLNRKNDLGAINAPNRDSRRVNKDCSVCGLETLMGVSENSPLRARERWNGTDYVRFCGTECEERGGW